MEMLILGESACLYGWVDVWMGVSLVVVMAMLMLGEKYARDGSRLPCSSCICTVGDLTCWRCVWRRRYIRGTVWFDNDVWTQP